jgi:hypothetical protein
MEPTAIDSKSWVAFPVAPVSSVASVASVTPVTPNAPDQQKWVAVLSGIAVFELQGTGSGSAWTHDELRLPLDDMLQAIFTFAQRTPSAGHHLRFVIEHTANFASINSIAASSGSHHGEFGVAVEAVEANIFGHTIHCFDGLTLKVAVANDHARDHARLLRVGFQTTLSGWIREFRTRGELG